MSSDSKLPWGIESQKIQPGSMKTISESKLATFAIGQQKKTRFQKSREEQELKRKQEEEAAAKIFDTFVASFTVEEEDSKTFVRGGKINDDGKVVGGQHGETYKLDKHNIRRGNLTEMDRMMEEMRSKEDKNISYKGSNVQVSTPYIPPSSSSVPSSNSELVRKNSQNAPPSTTTTTTTTTGAGSSRQIDDFLNEIKMKQERKANRNNADSAGSSSSSSSSSGSSGSNKVVRDDNGNLIDIITETKGSFDDGDPNTTNIYIGNLAPTVTEEELYDLFKRYGAINSVKVMWPRTDEERNRKRNSGFVSFMNRSDAEEAKIDLHDYTYEGYKMVLSWGKAVKINSCPFILQKPNTPLPPPTTTTSALKPVLTGNVPPPPPPPPIPHPNSIIPMIVKNVSDDMDGLPITSSNNNNDTESTTVNVPVNDSNITCIYMTTVPPPPPPSQPFKPPAPPTTSAPIIPIPDKSVLPSILTTNITTTTTPATNTTTSTTNGNNTNNWDTTAAPIAPLTNKIHEMKETDARITIQIPNDPKRVQLIHLLAKYVAMDGEVFEKSIRQKEESNPEYEFLYKLDHPDSYYYRWRVYANLMSDTEKKWSEKPFQITSNVIFIIPPPMPQDSHSKDRKRSRSRSVSRDRHPRLYRNHEDDLGDEGNSGKRGRRRYDSRSPSSESRMNRHRHNNSHSRSRSRSRSPTSRDRYHHHHHHHHHSRRSRSRSDSRDRYTHTRTTQRAKDKEKENDRKKYAGMTGAQIERLRAKERGENQKKIQLSDTEYDEFCSLLQGITLSRTSIKVIMGFVYDKVEASEEIMKMIKQSLLIATTPPPVKIARLYLLSDILHNSAAPVKYASNYRVEIQNILPEIFESLGAMRRHVKGRMKLNQIDERLKRLFFTWEEWSILSPPYLLGLEAAFYESDTDRNILETIIKEEKLVQVQLKEDEVGNLKEKEVKDAISSTPTLQIELDTLKRQAKLYGIYIHPQSTVKILQAKIDYYKRYESQKLQNLYTGPSVSQLAANILSLNRLNSMNSVAANQQQTGINTTTNTTMTTTTLNALVDEYNIDDEENEDIDGVPIPYELHDVWSNSNKMTNYSHNTQHKNVNDDDDVVDEEDIDGVPYDFADHMASLAQSSTASGGMSSLFGVPFIPPSIVTSQTHSSSIANHHPIVTMTSTPAAIIAPTHEEDDDIDGVPIEEDIDGIPI